MKKYSRELSLGLALFLAFIQGVVYVFLMPPWQHYDEPSHFEYVWLLANGASSPTAPDLGFRTKLVQSMEANDFFRGVPVPSLTLVEAGDPIYGLEYSQLDERPLYYWLASLPVRVLQDRNPAVMLLGARMVSVGLFVLTVWAVWGLTCELTPSNHWLRIWVPLSVALLPGFVDLMTAVNNDVGAVMAFSFFLWGSLYFLNRPRFAWGVLWVLGSALLCLGMKSTAYFAAPLSILVLMLGWIKGPLGKWVWAGALLLGMIGGLSLLTWEDAAYWHRATSQSLPTRVQTPNAPLGQYALQIDPPAPTTPDFIDPLQQPLPPLPIHTPLTLGVWMWVSEPVPTSLEIRAPILNTHHEVFYETFLVNATPQFFAYEVQLTTEANWFWLSLSPHLSAPGQMVFYDGFVLVEGQFAQEAPPVFDGPDALSGTWGGKPFQNLIRNPSAESFWPAIRPTIDNQLARLLPNNARLSTLLFGLLDWPRTESYFRITTLNLSETFWGRFGWGHVPLRWSPAYPMFRWLTLFSLLGCGLHLIQRKRWPDAQGIFLILAMMVVWGAALLRGEIFIFAANLFIPGARYAYPVIAPTMFVWMLGYLTWGKMIKKSLPFPPIALRLSAHIIPGLFFLALNLTAIYAILFYYQRI